MPNGRVFVGGGDAGRCLDAGNVGSQEVDPVPVEVVAGAIVVLGSAWVGVPGQDLSVSERYACVEGVGDGRVSQGVRADVAWDAGGFRDPGDRPVGVAAVDRIARSARPRPPSAQPSVQAHRR